MDYSKNENKNLNFVMVKNIDDHEPIDFEDYVSKLKNKILLDNISPFNKNVNFILIVNIVSHTEVNIEPTPTLMSLIESGETIIQSENTNINLIIVKNIIPLWEFEK